MFRVIQALFGFATVLCCIAGCRPEHASSQESRPGAIDCNDPRSLFSNGKTRVSAIFQLDLQITNDEWTELSQLFLEFGESHGLSFRDSSEVRDVVKILYLSLCAANQPNIEVAEQRWEQNAFAPPIPGRGIGMAFYGEVPEAVWHPLAVDIVMTLEGRWPQRVRFLNGDGRWIDRPAFLDAARPGLQ